MVRINTRIGLALLTAVALASPAAAEEQHSDWLGAVGDFVSAGLGPARTLDDIRREEERAREAAMVIPEAAPAPEVAPPPPAAEIDTAPPPVVAAPAAPVMPRSAMPAPRPAGKPVVPVAAPAPAPIPVPAPRPKPVVPVAVAVPAPVPAPEPPSSRIAATATVDQAIKLGGSVDNYGSSAAKPVGN